MQIDIRKNAKSMHKANSSIERVIFNHKREDGAGNNKLKTHLFLH